MKGVERLWWAAALPRVDGPLRQAAWGRLLVVRDSSSSPTAVMVTFARPVTPAASRFAALRLGTGPVANASATHVTTDAIWLSGDDVPVKGWAEVRSSVGGPAFVTIEELASGPAGTHLTMLLADRRELSGAVTDTNGRPAPGALVTLFRLIDPLAAPTSQVKPRRVFAGETTADERGEFAIENVGEADYEIVGWHPQLGRASLALDALQSRVDVHLSAPSLARGRVVSRGRPVAGISVISVPDPVRFNDAGDVTDVKGGDARTDADGRFAVMLAPTGGGELRIGGGSYAVTRVPLPATPATSVDLGEVEIAAPISFVVTIEGDPGCILQAVGPIGRMGLQIVNAARDSAGHRISVPESGLWQFGLLCAAGRRSLAPGSMSVTPGLEGTVVRFVVR